MIATLIATHAAETSYTIEFKSGTGASSGTAVNTIAKVIKSGSEYVSSLSATNLYETNLDYGLRLSSNKNAGTLILTLSANGKVTPTKVVVNTAVADANGVLKVNGTQLTYTNSSKPSGTPNYENITVPGIATDKELTELKFEGTGGKRVWIKSVTVYYEGNEATVAAPTFNPAAGSIAAGTEVAIACSTEGAKIYYTLDGTEPTDASTPYTAPVAINASCMLKAIAYDANGNASKVASAEYTVIAPISLREAMALADKATFIMGSDVVVTYANGAFNYVYDSADNAYGLIYKFDLGLTAGDLVKSGWQGSMSIYSQLPELVPSTTLITDGTADVPAPTTITNAAEITTDLLFHTVVLKSVNFDAATPGETVTGKDRAYTGDMGGTTVNFFNNFKTQSYEAGVYDVTAIVSTNNGNLQVLPISMATVAGAVAVPVASKASDTYDNAISVEFTCSTDGATIYYTTAPQGDVEPSAYTEPLTIDSNTIIAAWAEKDGVKSETVQYSYSFQVAAPVVTPAAGTLREMPEIAIESATDEAVIYYTLDGTEPTAESALYEGPFTPEAAETLTVKAIATRGTWVASEVVTAEYVINPNAPTSSTVVFAAEGYFETPAEGTVILSNYTDTDHKTATIDDKTFDGAGVSFLLTQGEKQTNWTNVNANDKQVRWYKGDIITLTPSEANKITKVVFYATSSTSNDNIAKSGTCNVTSTVGSLSYSTTANDQGLKTITWTGETTDPLVLTAENNQTRFNYMEVTLETHTGIDNIEAEANDADAPVEYYDMQGRRVVNPAAGLYIRRQGNTVTKVIVK